MRIIRSRRDRTVAVLAVATAAAIGVSGCSSTAKSNSHKVAIVAYSVPKPAYDALTAAFEKTSQGKGVSFSSSYGPSGTQSQAVAHGQQADYVAFSLQPDLDKLVPKFVAKNWSSGPTNGLVSSSVVVIVVRKGNPKHITGWADLVKPGVKIVTPDPASSGSAKWNILAAYTHVLEDGGTDAQAQTYLKSFFGNVVAKPSSGSNATSTFENGTGDVLISYENEAITAQQKGEKLDYVTPPATLLIQNPDAVVNKSKNRKAADAFLAFLRTDGAQRIFASKGYRSVNPKLVDAKRFPKPAKLFTIEKFGGWGKVNDKFFDPTQGAIAKIFQSQGKSTGG